MSLHQTDYDAQWADLRLRDRLFWFIFLSYMPGVAFITYLVHLAWPDFIDRVGFIVAIPWMAAFLVAGIYRMSFNCPRCGKKFFHSWRWSNSFARKCVHCGLKRWSGPLDLTHQ
jgi:hypothetical protein